MHVQIVTFGLKGLGDGEYRSHCDAMAPAFAQLPGLVSKTWLANTETNAYGGVYLWRDRRAMEDYEVSDIYKGMLANPHLDGLSARDFSVIEAATKATSDLGPRLVHAPGGPALLAR